MVHALEEIQRLLKPDGCLVDIHPLIGEGTIEVHQNKKTTFAEAVPAFDKEDIHQAERALAQVVQRKLLLVERTTSFAFLIYASSIRELLAYFEEANAFEEEQIDGGFTSWAFEIAAKIEEAKQAAGEGAEVVYSELVKISRLKPHLK